MNIKKYFLLAVSFLLFSACEYDNYEPPKSMLTGTVMYNNEPVRVASAQVTFRLFQSGFDRREPITVQVGPDGSYHAMLFNGTYQLVLPSGQGPYVQNTNMDTLEIVVKGETEQNIEVLPYYSISDLQLSTSDRKVDAALNLEKIVTGDAAREIESVSLFVNTTRFANIRNNVVSSTISGADITNLGAVQLSAEVPELTPSQGYVFARIGVKIQNVEDRLFSKVEKVQLK